jgi:hypothetical protein
MNADEAILDAEQNGCSVCFATATFLAPVKQIADQIFVQPVSTSELSDAQALAIKCRAGLLGCEGGGHSVHTCAFVLMWTHS